MDQSPQDRTKPPEWAENEEAVPTIHLDETTLKFYTDCYEKYKYNEVEPGGCKAFFDSLLCWPPSRNNAIAILSCPDEVHGIHYDTTKNATRLCLDEKWADVANYSQCTHLDLGPEEAEYIELPTIIYLLGYTVSFLALLMAVVVFIKFKDLRCLRNTIHANLFVTYIMTSFLWILTLILQVLSHSGPVICTFLAILFQYFSLTNFYWMLVEGLYLYMLVVETFTGENLRFGLYAFIGWGCPAIFVFCWSIARALSSDDEPASSKLQSNKLEIECSWMREKHIDWILIGPTLVVLLINCVFLIRIMWVLITKLRSANTAETKQYRKASKALLVLLPLLGITYLVVLSGPSEGIMRSVFDIFRALLLSTQGFSVSLFFCFLNTEVQRALHHKFVRWREERNITQNRRLTLTTPACQ